MTSFQHDHGQRPLVPFRMRNGDDRGFRDAGVDVLELSTDDDLVDAVMRFADLRKRQRSRGSASRHLEALT